MAKIELWFPTVIYTEENLFSDEVNKRWEQRLLEMEKNIPSGGKEWEGKTYTTHNEHNLKSDPDFKLLIDVITDHVNVLAKEHGSISKYICDNAWANISRNGNFQEYHTHDGSVFSAVYYVTAPMGSGNIVFEDPRMPDMLPIRYISERNHLSFVKVGYAPKAGNLLIFRSYLRHCVQTGSNNEPRISIALNFGYE